MKKVALGAFVFLLLLSSFIFAQEIEVNGLMITGVLNTTAKVSWSTNIPTSENAVFYRVKDAAEWQEITLTGSSDTHLQALAGLTASTDYEVKVMSGATESAVSEFSTMASIYGFTTPKMFTARILQEDGVTPSANSLVYIQLRHHENIVPNFSIAAMTSDAGWFSVDLSAFLKAGYSISAGDMVVITVNGGMDGIVVDAVEVEISTENATVYEIPVVVTDTAAPQFLLGRSYNEDSAYTNRVELTFNESLQGTLPVGFTVYDTALESNVTINSAEFVGNTIVFDIAGMSSGQMTISYDSATGNITDNANTPNVLAAITDFALTDEVATTIASVEAMDERNNAAGDYVIITFSEPVTVNTYALESPIGNAIAEVPTATVVGNVVTETYGHAVLTVGQAYKVAVNVTENSGSGLSFDLEGEGTVLTNDTEAPVVVITAPENNSVFSASEMLVAGTVSGEEDASVIEYKVNGEANWHAATTVDAESFSFTLSSLVDGDYSVEVRGTDIAGNISESAMVMFSIDLTNPVVTLDAVNGTVLAFPVIITGSVASAKDSGLKNVTYSVDNATPAEWMTSNMEINGTEFTITLVNELTDGEHTVYVRAEDNAGNMSETASVTFTVILDVEAPAIQSVVINPEHANYAIPGVQILVQFQDMPEAAGTFTGIDHTVIPGIEVVPFEGDAVTVNHTSYSSGLWIGFLSTSELNNGTAQVNLVSGAADNAGNVMTAVENIGTFTIYNDDMAPVLVDAEIAPAYANDTAVISLHFQDMPEAEGDFSGIDYDVYPIVSITSQEGEDVVATYSSYAEGVWIGTVNVSDLANGEAHVNIVSGPADNAGNVMVATENIVPFVIDTMAPAIELSASPLNSETAPAHDGEFIFSGTILDANDFEAKYYIDDENETDLNVAEDGTFSVTIDFTTMKLPYDETHTFQIVATDEATNISEEAVSVYFDITDPAITINPVAPITNGESVVIAGTVNDAVTKGEIAAVELKVNDNEWMAVDFAEGAYSYTLTVVDGNYTVKARTTDMAGNVSAEAEVSFLVDQTEPTLIVNVTPATSEEAPANTNTFHFNGSLIEDGSGLDSFYYTVNGGTEMPIDDEPGVFNFDLTLQNENVVVITAIDNATNTKTWSQTFYIDVIAPVVVLNNIASPTNVVPVHATGTVTDAAKGKEISTVEYSLNNAEWTAITLSENTFDVELNPGDGEHIIKVRAIDTAGNISNIPERNFEIDTVAPSFISLNVPASDENTPLDSYLVTVSGSLSENGSGLSEFYYQVNEGTPIQIQSNPGTFSVNIDFSSFAKYDEMFTLTVVAIDNAGNSVTETENLYFDAAAPVVTLNPMENYYTGHSVTFSGTVEDPSIDKGVLASLEYKLNEGVWTAITLPEGTAYSQELTLEDGSYTVMVRATDTAGNISNIPTENFVVDTTVPVLSNIIVSPAYANTEVNVSFNIAENGSGLNTAMTSVIINEAEVIPTQNTASYWQGKFNVSALSNGTYTVSLNVYDNAGNGVTNEEYSFIVDKAAPVIENFKLARTEADVWIMTANISETYLGSLYYKMQDDDEWMMVNEYTLTGTDFSYEIGELSSNQYTFKLKAIDMAGNTSNVPVYKIDTNPLEIAYNGMNNFEVTELPLVIEVEVSKEVRQINYSLDEGDWTALEKSGSVYRVTINSLKEGNHALIIRAEDLIGDETNITINFHNKKFLADSYNYTDTRNFPNPVAMDGEMTVAFRSDREDWSVKIFDFSGKEVTTLTATKNVSARRDGDYQLVTWDCSKKGSKVAPGIYLGFVERSFEGKSYKERLKIAVVE